VPGREGSVRGYRRRSPEELDRLAAGTPLRQLASPEDVAGAILLFAIEEVQFQWWDSHAMIRWQEAGADQNRYLTASRKEEQR
jgi:hypothetical protein